MTFLIYPNYNSLGHISDRILLYKTGRIRKYLLRCDPFYYYLFLPLTSSETTFTRSFAISILSSLSSTRRHNNKTEYITQVVTGNYNEKTARLYTDLSVMTANKSVLNEIPPIEELVRIGGAARAVFRINNKLHKRHEEYNTMPREEFDKLCSILSKCNQKSSVILSKRGTIAPLLSF